VGTTAGLESRVAAPWSRTSYHGFFTVKYHSSNQSTPLHSTCYILFDAPLMLSKTTNIIMKHTFLIASAILHIAYSKTSSELCRGTDSKAPDGNWYCSEVLAITYRNISQAGAYNQTTSVDPKTGICAHTTVGYEGSGPLTPLFGEVSMHLRGPMNVSQFAVYQLPGDMHTLQKRSTMPFYMHQRELNKREPIQPTTTPEPKREMMDRAGADWSRVAYYTSTAPAQATGLSFLANLGDPQMSGTFD
jgi:hypothetical protein